MNIVDGLRIASAVLYGICIFLYGDKLLKRRAGKMIIYLVVGIISCLFAVSALTTTLIPILYIGMYIILFIMFQIYFEGTKMMHAFAAGNFIFHLLCLKGILISSSALLFKIGMYNLVNRVDTYALISIFLFISATVFLLLFQFFYPVDKIKKVLNDSKAPQNLFYIQLLLNVFLMVTSLIYYLEDTSIWLTIYHLIISLMILLGFYIIFQFIIKTIQENEDRENINNLKLQVDLEIKRYNAQINYIQNLRQIKHDYIKQITGLEHVLVNKGEESALTYIKDINKEFKRSDGIYQRFSDHTLLNVLLQEYASTCRKSGIKFEALLLVKCLNISDLHLCTLFSNLLDNAVEACMKTEIGSERFIKISCTESGNWQVIIIKNSFDGLLLKNEKGLKTTKKDGEEHGLGMKRAMEIMSENGGMLKFKTDKNERAFLVQLMFPNSIV